MPISDEVLDEIERALSAGVELYYSTAPIRNSDTHRVYCTCPRCVCDRQQDALARLREERRK